MQMVGCAIFVLFATFFGGSAMPVVRHQASIIGSESHKKGSVAVLSLGKVNRSNHAVCDEHIKQHPSDIHCPMECPYLRAEPTRLCQFKCVPASACNADNPLASYANPQSMRCEACNVAGCHHCGESRDSCVKCQDGFDLIDGGCFSNNRNIMKAVWIILGLAGLLAAWYVIALFFFRSSKNEQVMEEGLKYRKASIVRVKNDRGELKKIKLATNLMTPEGMVMGPGLMLHFRWMGAVVVWAICATILFGAAGIAFHERLGVFKGEPNSRKSYDVCENNVKMQKQLFNDMEAVYFACTLILFFFTFIGSLWFASLQRGAYRMQDVKNLTHKDFVVVASGFPSTPGSEEVENNQLSWFKEQPQFDGLNVVGVSVCWDYRDKTEDVNEQVRREFDIHSSEADAEYKKNTEGAMSFRDKKHRTCIDPQLKSIDAVFGIGNFPCAKTETTEEQPQAHNVKEMLESMSTSGVSFVILGSTQDQDAAIERCQKTPLSFKKAGETYDITIESTEAEPISVMWQGYGTKHLNFVVSIVLGCFAVFLGVILLDIFFYAPYVYYILSYSNVAGMSQGGVVSGLFLGLLITVCNQAIYFIIGSVADRCGWTNSDSKDTFYCVKYTLAVFFNTIVDLGTVLILAQGYSVDQAMAQQIADDSTMGPKSIAESPNMQKAIYEQLVMYIFPSCTLLPFLIEPIATTLGPYYLGKALVRSRREVTVQDAEECLQNPPYDLSRYGDVLVNMMLCCMTLLFTYRDLWTLFFYLIISMSVIYTWDHVRALRFSTKGMFSTNSMDNAVMYMMSFPSGVILMCLVFKTYGATHQGFLDNLSGKGDHAGTGLRAYLGRNNIILYMLAAFFVNMLVQCLLLQLLVVPLTEKKVAKHISQMEDKDEGEYPLVGAERPANFFNTNPVNCLRSKYIYANSPPCVFYRVGKENLLKKNEKLGLFFEAEDALTPRTQRMESANKIQQAKNQLKQRFDSFTGGV